MKRILTIISVTVLAILMVNVLSATPLTYRTIPFDFVVVQQQPSPGVVSIEAYADNETSMVLAALHFGESRQVSIWAKNLGNASGNITMVANNPFTWGNLDFNPSTFTLAPGQVQRVDLSLGVLSSVQPGTYSDNFTVRD